MCPVVVCPTISPITIHPSIRCSVRGYPICTILIQRKSNKNVDSASVVCPNAPQRICLATMTLACPVSLNAHHHSTVGDPHFEVFALLPCASLAKPHCCGCIRTIDHYLLAFWLAFLQRHSKNAALYYGVPHSTIRYGVR
jgi:hypothetical protein